MVVLAYLCLYFRIFGVKMSKTCQFRDLVSRKRIEIFKFCKKYMKLHVMDINICENEKIDQDPLSP